MMDASVISFYVISAFLLTFGLMAVTAKKIFRSAIWLLFSLVGIASLYFWMDLQFLAAVQIIVYIGGIVVLIIFSIFLTQDSGSALPKAIKSRKIGAALLSVFGFGIIATLLVYPSLFMVLGSMGIRQSTTFFVGKEIFH